MTDTATTSSVATTSKPKPRWYLARGYNLAGNVLTVMLAILAPCYVYGGWDAFVRRYFIVVVIYAILIPIRFLRRSSLPPMGATLVSDEASP
jgi:hypothetical protein